MSKIIHNIYEFIYYSKIIVLVTHLELLLTNTQSTTLICEPIIMKYQKRMKTTTKRLLSSQQ